SWPRMPLASSAGERETLKVIPLGQGPPGACTLSVTVPPRVTAAASCGLTATTDALAESALVAKPVTRAATSKATMRREARGADGVGVTAEFLQDGARILC